MMEMLMWWEWDTDTKRPWRYEVTYLGMIAEGRCAEMADCWQAVALFVEFATPAADEHPRVLQ